MVFFMSSMKNKIKDFYIKQLFLPNFWSIFINPIFICRKKLSNTIKKHSHHMNGKMLDFGCGNKPYKEFFQVDEYIGLEFEGCEYDTTQTEIEMLYDGKNIPFEDDYFDSIYCSEVFEHLLNLEEILMELNRVLKIDGKMLISIPFMNEEHPQPIDFARYTSFGIKYLLEKHGFEVLISEKIPGFFESFLQIWNFYLGRIVLPKNHYIKSILAIFIIFPFNLLAIIISKIKLFPEYKEFYINNVIVAQKIKRF